MIRLLLLSNVALFFVGCCCVSKSGTTSEPDDATVLNAWFEELDRENFALHDILLEALVYSRQSGKVVFVRRVEVPNTEEPQRLYRLSFDRGGADNIVGVNFATREFLFDHFLPSDGPTLNQIRQQVRDRGRIRQIKKDLGIFGIR